MMDPAVWLEQNIPGGAPADQFRLVLCTLLSYPFGYLFKKLPSNTAQNWYALILGLCYGWYCFGVRQMFHPVFVATLSYYLCLKKPKQAAPYVCVFAFAYLCFGHIYRMWNDYMGWTMDYTTAQMLVTLRVVQFACNVQDMHREDKDLHAEEKEDRLARMPGPLEYYAFMFFFPAFLFGPNCGFNQYAAFVNRRQNPSTVLPSLTMLGHALLCYVVIILAIGVPLEFVLEPEFRQMHIGQRLIYSWAAVVGGRFRYYFIWCLSEGACTACGVTYNGTTKSKITLWDRVSGAVDGKGNRWDLVKHVNIFGVELAQNGKQITDNWNMSVGRFLYVYVYQRITRPGKGRPGTLNIYVTQMLCAFWHGFYPGYYMTFFSTAGAVAVTRTARRYIRPIVLEKFPRLNPLYCVCGWALTCSVFSWMMASFMLLGFSRTIQFWNAIHWIPHILAYGGALLLYVVSPQLVALRKRLPDAPKKDAKINKSETTNQSAQPAQLTQPAQLGQAANSAARPVETLKKLKIEKMIDSPPVGTPPEIGDNFGELTPPSSPVSPRSPVSAVYADGKIGRKGSKQQLGVIMPMSLRRTRIGDLQEGSISHRKM